MGRHNKTLLDVFLLGTNLAIWILQKETAKGASTCDDNSVIRVIVSTWRCTAYHPDVG